VPGSLSLEPVSAENWRDVARLEVRDDQNDFVAQPCYYLCLCRYGGLWQPLAVRAGDQVVGHLMWAIDPDDGSCWLGGILIDRRFQRQGLGRRAVQAALEKLSREQDCKHFALSYQPVNKAARQLYASLGFVETGECEDDEIVARLELG
jgi:diamine N-acetyltransferase